MEVEGADLYSRSEPIDRYGVKDPLRVFLKEDDLAELIDGHRRLSTVHKLLKKYRASSDPALQAKAASLAELPCLVEEVSPSVKKHLELQVLLNAVRKNFSPVEQARYLLQIKDLEPGMTQKELGALLPGGKKTQGYVSRLLILAQDGALLQRVEEGELTAAEAYRRVAKRQEKSKAKKGGEATGPSERDASARMTTSTASRKKSQATKERTADSVLFEWQEKETRVNVVVTGPAAHKENILFVLHSLVRRLDDEARLKPGGD